MTPERWACIEELFHQAAACGPDQRAQLLEETGKTDPDLRREVEALLSAQRSAVDHLEAAVQEGRESAFTAGTLDSSEVASGSIIGPYCLIEQIGEGGMGEVWLAEQKQPVRRRVALKLIKAGMDTREIVKRFESERQALALMDHPAIAKVFDAGSTPQSRPYFVMEYVVGMSITAYCDRHKLTTRERLELFARVCEGVQHAHQKAIIHRDLKPSNILVSEVDGKPMPRIIDFGVAKAISQPLTAETMYTRAGAVVGTPGYMSPEQADSAGEDIDTRTDVYSLGVVLYELLVGALPLDFEKLPFDQILRRLREQDAPRPSTKLRSLGPKSTTTAQNRGTDPPTLARLLRGDLDAITLRALEKDRARRYGSPSELAADIGRYLHHEPVHARPASTVYRTRKYVRRHRIGVALAAAFALLLATAAIAQSVQLRRVTRERDRADRITQFMTDMFRISDPSRARGSRTTAQEILDKASRDIDSGLANDPELQARMMYTMAVTYDHLDLMDRVRPLAERAEQIQRRALGPTNRETLASMSLLGWSRLHVDPIGAEALLRETLAKQRQAIGSENPDTLLSMSRLASMLEQRKACADADRLYREKLAIQTRVLGREHADTSSTRARLAATLSNCERRFPEAESLLHESLDMQRRVLGPKDPATINTTIDLAQTFVNEGRYAEAEKYLDDVLVVGRQVWGPGHRRTLETLEWKAYAVARQGRYSEAEKLFREAVETSRKTEKRELLAEAWVNFACGAASAGRREDALAYLGEAVRIGYNAEVIEQDEDLKSLHGDPRFDALVARTWRGAGGGGRAKTQ